MILAALAIALLTLSLAIYLTAPLFSGETAPAESAAANERLELATRQASVYATLKELDFDLATGKLTEEDHRELKERFSVEAVEILQKLDALQRGGGGSPPRRR